MLLLIVFLTIILIINVNFVDALAVRGLKGDLWADKVFGKRDFGENSPKKVVPYKLHSPGGVIVDRSVSPGRAYVWDAGNSRVVGIDLATCYAKDIDDPCVADIIIGQPSGTDYGACNQDASFSDYPNRKPASATSLCGVGEWTHSTLEDKSFTSMATDASGNLYVADFVNHRVLKYISPFTTDTVADQVWGQSDFTGNLCNRTGQYLATSPAPNNNTLCFYAIGGGGSGVTIDSTGNLWVADGGNNRILRFPFTSGSISSNADLVIGQIDFISGGDYSQGTGLNQLASPSSIGFDNLGNLYVSEQGNNRILKYTPPFSNGMSGTVVLEGTDFHEYIITLQMTPAGDGFFTFEREETNSWFNKWDLNGTKVVNEFYYWNPGGGSLGIDALGNVLSPSFVYGNGIIKHVYNSGTNTYDIERELFSPPGSYNETSVDRLEQGGWAGLGVLSNNQMVVSDGRLLFWDNPLTLANGAAPTGYIGGTSGVDLSPDYRMIAVDASDRIYVQRGGVIEIFQGPLTQGETPILTLSGTLDLAGGGTIALPGFNGMTVSENSEFLWLSDGFNNRVIRIRNPLTAPVVDVVIGQANILGTECNRGVPYPSATIYTLCNPGSLKLDKFNNLYISDHFFELYGNYRILMFKSDLFPDSPSTVIFDTPATKEFPWLIYSFASFEQAFDSSNRMVIGFNPYTAERFLKYFDYPASYNVSNPSDTQFAIPSGSLNDFYGWAFALSFDSNDNLYVYDTNRGKVLVYLQPFIDMPVISQVTAVSALTTDSTPLYTFYASKPGTISYSGACASPTTVAVAGNNQIEFNTLGVGIYSNCTITLTDDHSNISNILTVSTFEVSTIAIQRRLRGDFNADGVVNLSDLSILASFWGQNVVTADANDDGTVGISDLSIVALNWLQTI